ncbi:Cobalt-precorrin 5A hydrolase [hydrothermal vent metagenome]|uniref:Cobalt-precorrin 5A hydrolase n=1 Tax=hydrothermal vent metagenome TaxID=652676 RepID=A0A3B1AFS2_9ZZZZ
MTNTTAKIALVAITKHGVTQMLNLAEKMPESFVMVSEKFSDRITNIANNKHAYTGALKAQIKDLFNDYDQIVFFISIGAVIRLVAPYLKSKDEDPGILIVDDNAEFVIPVLSGHVGGANDYAIQIANLLNATAVVTTASDVGKTIPVDILGRELGWKIEAPKINITRVSAHVVNEEAIAFIQESGNKNWWTRSTPLPRNIHLFTKFEDVDLNTHKAILWVTHRDIEQTLWQNLEERLVVYRPPAD